MTKLPAALLFTAVLLACAEPAPNGTGGNGGTSSGASSSGGGTIGGSTGGATSGGVTGGTSTGGSSGTTGGMGCGGCPSGSCLGGHCCTTACRVDDPTGTCVPTSCGTDGSCAYPGSTVACGGGCDSNNHFTRAGSCNGAGSCSSITLDCGQFTCLSTGCPTFCADDTVCVAGAHCFLPQRTCCPAIAPGATIYVDSSIGSDTGCCGSGPGSAACQTLTTAMGEIERSHATGVTIKASVNGTIGNWTAPETWPVTLHLGVTLHAPGVYFFVPDALSNYVDAFDVKPFDANDRLPVVIEGDAQYYAVIGFDSNAAQYANTQDGVSVIGLTLKIGSVWLNGSSADADVGDNGTLEIDGYVQLGNFQNVSHTSTVVSYDGIACGGTGMAATANVSDPGAMDGNLMIQGQSNAGIHAYSFCTVNLQHAATFGVPPVQGICPVPKPDSYGVLAEGDPLQITLNSPLIQCMDNQGVQLYSGNPIVTLNKPVIAHCGCAGLSTFAGTLYSNGGAIVGNHWGALQEDGQIFLNGGGTGGVGGGNIVGCSTELEPGLCYLDGFPGVDVENDSTLAMNADNCFLDNVPPSKLKCMDAQYNGCSCLSTTACSPPSDYDGVDLVVISGGGALTTQNVSANGLGCH